MFRIEKGTIPAHISTDPTFSANISDFETSMRARLSKRNLERNSNCVHEAAHELYYKQLGIRTTRHGPEILYDPDKNEIYGASAKVVAWPPFPPDISLARWAKCFAAGGVAQRTLVDCTGIDVGDGLDFRDFRSRCLSKFPFAELEIQRFWDEAKAAVATDFRSPTLRKEIWRITWDFEKEVFGE